MKILIDARLYGLEHAGLGRYAINLVNELSKIDKKSQYQILLRKKYYHKLKLPKNWQKILADIPHYSVAEQVSIPRIIAKEEPDLVHYLHFNAPVLVKTKFVATVHDILMHIHKSPSVTTLPDVVYRTKRIGYKIVFDKAVKKAEKLIVPSKFTKNEIVKHYGLDEDKIVVTYEGVDPAVITNKKQSKKLKSLLSNKYFLYVGNAYPHKNLSRVIEATVLLNQTSEEKVFLYFISSRNVFTQRLEETAKKLEAEQYVKFLGFVNDQDLGQLYKKSLGFVYASLYEGFGLPGLEAISSGTLVLASDIFVFKEVYENSAIYFNPYDFSSIAGAMKDVLDMDPKKRAELIKNSQSFIKKYSWRKMAEQTLQVYRKVACGEDS